MAVVKRNHTYLALGDSMSIDDYTGVAGGGAAGQFARSLGREWTFKDRTYDGCRMAGVPHECRGDVVSLTIGGNDLLWNREAYLREGLRNFACEHLGLLEAIRHQNPRALIIIGDIYAPAMPLSVAEQTGLAEANAVIRRNGEAIDAVLAPISETFRGHESEYLCLGIEPTLKGATAIARLFRSAFDSNWRSQL
jgi:hypothetical protein